ncbi:hypothetical protein O1L68_42570 [Streptomyces lydicus]|nr:hypothetical protein [Streptomyces lydicus]
MSQVTQDEGDARYGEGRSFRPLGEAERTLFGDLAAASPRGERALDVSCGVGELARHLATR